LPRWLNLLEFWLPMTAAVGLAYGVWCVVEKVPRSSAAASAVGVMAGLAAACAFGMLAVAWPRWNSVDRDGYIWSGVTLGVFLGATFFRSWRAGLGWARAVLALTFGLFVLASLLFYFGIVVGCRYMECTI
jgi:hypothetical protein